MPLLDGHKLRGERKARGYKAGEFAKLVRGSTKHLLNVEAGSSPCSEEYRNRCALALGVDPESLPFLESA